MGATTWARIEGMGMFTPVGTTAAQTASSVRALISAYAASSVINRNADPMTLALVAEEAIPPCATADDATGLSMRARRMLRLAVPALAEALHGLDAPVSQLPLFLAVSEALPDADDALPPVGDAFLEHLLHAAGGVFSRQHSELFPGGRAGGLQALGRALEALASGRFSHVLVGGVDTHLDARLLATLDAAGRVLADNVMDGFAPGEGACFLLLASARSQRTAAAGGPAPAPVVFAPALAMETGHRYSEAPNTGDGLAEAVLAALRALAGRPAATVLASLNGEHFGTREWGVARLRAGAAILEHSAMLHPAECFGDTGAAIAPLLLGLACIGMMKGHVRGPCLVWCASEGPLRGAVAVDLAAPA